jgi:hypothetical protein
MTKATHKYVGGVLGLFLLGIAADAGIRLLRNLKEKQRTISGQLNCRLRYSRRDVIRLNRELAHFALAE